MKTTLMFRQMIANPRRTTLAHLKDATELTAASTGAETGTGAQDQAEVGSEAAAAGTRALPQRTANPRRTVLTELPKASVAP